jgi:hypothetical protein
MIIEPETILFFQALKAQPNPIQSLLSEPTFCQAVSWLPPCELIPTGLSSQDGSASFSGACSFPQPAMGG